MTAPTQLAGPRSGKRIPREMCLILHARFWAKVDKRNQNDCWLWMAACQQGYGVFCPSRQLGAVKAHRWSWTELVGEIPEGMTLDHLCRNRSCVNPGHLEVVDARTNTLRGTSPVAKNAVADFCARGHRLGDAYVQKSGRRVGRRRCRICAITYARSESGRRSNRVAVAKYRAQQREEVMPL